MEEYFIHNFYMAEIADCIINDKVPLQPGGMILGNNMAKYQVGVKEIIGLYLLIPYINNESNRLKYDSNHRQIGILDDDDIAFYDIDGRAIKIKNLRDTLCHSFVSCEAPEGEEPYIIFDDRITMSRSEHNRLAGTVNGSKCVLVKNCDVLAFLKRTFYTIKSLNQHTPDDKTKI